MDINNKEEQPEFLTARFGKAIRKGFSDAYDRFGQMIAASLIWVTSAAVPISIGWELQRQLPTSGIWFVLAGIIASIIISAPVIAGIFKMAYKTAYYDDPGLDDIFSGARELFLSSIGLAVINVFIVLLLLIDAMFFMGLFGPLKGNWFSFGLGIFFLYMLTAWLMSAVYHLPVLAAQKPLGQRTGAIAAVKKSLIFAAHNPGFTIGLFVVILGFSILCAVSVLGMLILFAGTVSIVLTHAVRELYIRYRVVEDTPEVVEDKGWNI